MKTRYKRLVAPLVLLIILVLGIWLLWPRNVAPPTLVQNTAGGKKQEPPVTAGMLALTDEMIIKNRFGQFHLTRKGDHWFISSPVKSRANDGLVAKIFQRLGGLKFGQIVTSDPATFKEHLLTEKRAASIHFKSKGVSQVELLVGRSRKFTLLRAAGSNEVWNMKGAFRQIIVRDSRDWVEPGVAPFKLKEVKSVTYLGPHGEKLFSFTKNKQSVYEVTYGKVPKDFYPRNVTASVAKLLRARLRKINDDRGHRESYFTHSPGAMEIILENGKKHLFRVGNREGKLVPLSSSLVEWIPLVYYHSIHGMLLTSIFDLVSPSVIALDSSQVTAIDGLCQGFSFGMERKGAQGFSPKKESMEFVPALSRTVKFLEMVKKGYLRAEKVMARLPVEKTGITPKSDFITLTHKDKKVTVRFGNVTDSPEGGKVWRYVETSEKPDYTFIVRGERCLEICRNKVNWQMAATDMEDLPHRSMKKARKPLAKKPDPPKGSMEKPK